MLVDKLPGELLQIGNVLLKSVHIIPKLLHTQNHFIRKNLAISKLKFQSLTEVAEQLVLKFVLKL
jgi:hypothetical protein